jgi:general secretion pathway protein D
MKTRLPFAVLTASLFLACGVLPSPAQTNTAPGSDSSTNAPAAVAPGETPQTEDQTPQPGDSAASTNPPTASQDAAASAPATIPDAKTVYKGKGLLLNFRNVPLESVLNYMSDAAGFIIHPMNGVNVRGNVTVWSAQPMSRDEAYDLLQKMLIENGYSSSRESNMLTITRSTEAKYQSTVISQADPDLIPKNDSVVTDIISIHSLNAVQLVKDLESLRPSGCTLSANDSANSLVMTGPQGDIHHFVEIVKALDSVNNSSASIKVFPLKYADSKATAALIKDLYPDPNASRTGAGGGGQGGGFGRFRGGGGGGPGGGFAAMFGGGAGGGTDPSETGHTPTAKVNAVSDDHSNTLIVNAPDAIMPDIVELVKSVDLPVDDATEVKVFHLVNADASETADLLSSLFSDDTSNATDATRTPFRFGPFGGFGGQQQGNNSTQSDRAKRLSKVTAVADRRTSSLVVTSGKDLMPQIEALVNELDARKDRKITPHLIALNNADPVEVQAILQDLFPASSTSTKASSLNITPATPLYDRQKAQLQQQNSTTTSSFGSSLGGGGGSSGGRGF